MSKYKIVGENSDRVSVANSDGGRDTFSKGHWKYDNFLQEVKEQGYSIVEGPTVGVTTDYKEARKLEYPPMEDQLDKIYHSGVNAWKADIKVIKDKYPKTQVGVTTVADIPSWVKEAVDAAD